MQTLRVPTSITEQEEVQVEVTRLLVECYFDIVRANLQVSLHPSVFDLQLSLLAKLQSAKSLWLLQATLQATNVSACVLSGCGPESSHALPGAASAAGPPTASHQEPLQVCTSTLYPILLLLPA